MDWTGGVLPDGNWISQQPSGSAHTILRKRYGNMSLRANGNEAGDGYALVVECESSLTRLTGTPSGSYRLQLEAQPPRVESSNPITTVTPAIPAGATASEIEAILDAVTWTDGGGNVREPWGGNPTPTVTGSLPAGVDIDSGTAIITSVTVLDASGLTAQVIRAGDGAPGVWVKRGTAPSENEGGDLWNSFITPTRYYFNAIKIRAKWEPTGYRFNSGPNGGGRGTNHIGTYNLRRAGYPNGGGDHEDFNQHFYFQPWVKHEADPGWVTVIMANVGHHKRDGSGDVLPGRCGAPYGDVSQWDNTTRFYIEELERHIESDVGGPVRIVIESIEAIYIPENDDVTITVEDWAYGQTIYQEVGVESSYNFTIHNNSAITQDLHLGNAQNGKISCNLFDSGGTTSVNGADISIPAGGTYHGVMKITKTTADGIQTNSQHFWFGRVKEDDPPVGINVAKQADVDVSADGGKNWTTTDPNVGQGSIHFGDRHPGQRDKIVATFPVQVIGQHTLDASESRPSITPLHPQYVENTDTLQIPLYGKDFFGGTLEWSIVEENANDFNDEEVAHSFGSSSIDPDTGMLSYVPHSQFQGVYNVKVRLNAGAWDFDMYIRIVVEDPPDSVITATWTAIAPTVSTGAPPVAEIKYASKVFDSPAGTDSAFDITIPGLGWTPKAAIVRAITGTTDGSRVDHAILNLGVAAENGTAWCMSLQQRDNRNVGTGSSQMYDGAFIIGQRNQSSAFVQRALFTSFIADGIRLDWNYNLVGVRKYMIDFWGGADFEAECGTVEVAAADVTITHNNVDDPDVAFLANCNRAGTAAANDAQLSFGWAALTGGSGAEVSQSIWSEYFNTTSSVKSIVRNNAAIINPQTGNTGTIADVQTNSFDISPSATFNNSDVGYLLLKFGGNSFDIGTVNPAATDWQVEAGIEAGVLYMGFSNVDTLNTEQSADPEASSFGFATNGGSVGISIEDNVSDTNCGSFLYSANDGFLLNYEGDGTLEDKIESPTFRGAPDSDVLFETARILNLGPTDRHWIYLAVEATDESDGTPITIVPPQITASTSVIVPTVVNQPLSPSVPTIVATASAIAPTAVNGPAHTIVADVITATATAIAPTAVVDPDNVVDVATPVTATFTAVTPTVVSEPIVVAPAPITADVTAVEPTVGYQPTTVAPSPIIASFSVVPPTVSTGSGTTVAMPVITATFEVTPPAAAKDSDIVIDMPVAQASWSAIAPAANGENPSGVQIDPVFMTSQVVPPSVVNGPLKSVVMPVVNATFTAVAPTVVKGSTHVIPVPPVSATAVAVAPTVSMGATHVVAVPSISALWSAAPPVVSVDAGITVTPNPITATVVATPPAVTYEPIVVAVPPVDAQWVVSNPATGVAGTNVSVPPITVDFEATAPQISNQGIVVQPPTIFAQSLAIDPTVSITAIDKRFGTCRITRQSPGAIKVARI